MDRGEPIGHQPAKVHTQGGHLLTNNSFGGSSHQGDHGRHTGAGSYTSSPETVQRSSGSNAAVAQLFARIQQEIDREKPPNCIHFIVGFLCKHYPEHLHGFASIWQSDPDLERERFEVVNFFKSHKISTAVAAHFTNAGFDTLDTLTTLNPDALVDVEAFNNVKWLPGHKVRLQQIFSEISARVRAYKQQNMGTSYVSKGPVQTIGPAIAMPPIAAQISSVATPMAQGLATPNLSTPMPQIAAPVAGAYSNGAYPGGAQGGFQMPNVSPPMYSPQYNANSPQYNQ
jgi:hypothetical protein